MQRGRRMDLQIDLDKRVYEAWILSHSKEINSTRNSIT